MQNMICSALRSCGLLGKEAPCVHFHGPGAMWTPCRQSLPCEQKDAPGARLSIRKKPPLSFPGGAVCRIHGGQLLHGHRIQPEGVYTARNIHTTLAGCGEKSAWQQHCSRSCYRPLIFAELRS